MFFLTFTADSSRGNEDRETHFAPTPWSSPAGGGNLETLPQSQEEHRRRQLFPVLESAVAIGRRVDSGLDSVSIPAVPSHSLYDVDPTSDVAAVSRTQIDFGASLVSRTEIVNMAIADEGLANPTGWISPKLLHLDTNPEVACDYEASHAFRMSYFEWAAGGNESVLGVPSGRMLNQGSSDYEFSKLVLFRMGDCVDVSTGVCSASTAPNGANTTLLIGSTDKSMAFSYETAIIGSTQYAFVTDTAGNVSAYDLTNAFSAGAGAAYTPIYEVARWSMPAPALDGFRSPAVDIVKRIEQSPGDASPELHLYVAASRYGLLRLRVTETPLGPDPIAIDLMERINTPCAASGLTLSTVPVTGEALLTVFDHDGAGTRLYTAQ